MCACVSTHLPWYMCGSQRTTVSSRFLLSTMLVLGMELSKNCQKSPFTLWDMLPTPYLGFRQILQLVFNRKIWQWKSDVCSGTEMSAGEVLCSWHCCNAIYPNTTMEESVLLFGEQKVLRRYPTLSQCQLAAKWMSPPQPFQLWWPFLSFLNDTWLNQWLSNHSHKSTRNIKFFFKPFCLQGQYNQRIR